MFKINVHIIEKTCDFPYLVCIVFVDDPIKTYVQIVKKVDNLHGRTHRRYYGKSNNIREK